MSRAITECSPSRALTSVLLSLCAGSTEEEGNGGLNRGRGE